MSELYKINPNKAFRTSPEVKFHIPSLIVAEGEELPSYTSYKREGERFRITGRLNTTTVKTTLDGEIKFEVTNNGPTVWFGTPGKDIKEIKNGETVKISQPTYKDFRMGSENREFDITISEPVVSVRYKEQKEVYMFIINDGNTESNPIIRIEKDGSDEVIVQVGGNRVAYIFPKGEDEVEIDTRTTRAYYKGEQRDAFVTLTDDFGVRPGVNPILVKSSAKVYVKRAERWF